MAAYLDKCIEAAKEGIRGTCIYNATVSEKKGLPLVHLKSSYDADRAIETLVGICTFEWALRLNARGLSDEAWASLLRNKHLRHLMLEETNMPAFGRDSEAFKALQHSQLTGADLSRVHVPAETLVALVGRGTLRRLKICSYDASVDLSSARHLRTLSVWRYMEDGNKMETLSTCVAPVVKLGGYICCCDLRLLTSNPHVALVRLKSHAFRFAPYRSLLNLLPPWTLVLWSYEFDKVESVADTLKECNTVVNFSVRLGIPAEGELGQEARATLSFIRSLTSRNHGTVERELRAIAQCFRLLAGLLARRDL